MVFPALDFLTGNGRSLRFGSEIGFPSVGRVLREPHVEIVPREEDIMIRVGLAGTAPEDIRVDINEDMLTLSVDTSGSEEDAESLHTWFSNWSKSYRLPVGTPPEDITAVLQDGLLTVTIPRTSASRGRRVPIQLSPRDRVAEVEQAKKDEPDDGDDADTVEPPD